jgi:Glycosyl hydrolases family 16
VSLVTERRDTTEEVGETGTGNGTSVEGDGGAAGDDGGAGAQPTKKGRSPWRRWRVVLVVVFLVTATLTLSPVSPFEQAQPHGRVPVPPGGMEPEPRPAPSTPPKPTPSLPPFPTIPGQPPPTGAPEPDSPPAPPDVPAPAPIRDAGYTLDYADDFGGGAPDPDVWANAPFGNSLPATVRDGHMTIRATEANDHHWGYVASTGPRSEGEPSYSNPRAWEQGYFEARVRYTDNPWSWPAFWLFSMAKTEAWPGEDCSVLNAEWDIMENGVANSEGDQPANRWYITNLHRNTTDNTPGGYCDTPDTTRSREREFPDTNLADWHTWAAYWSSDRFCTYMDDVELLCMEPYDSTAQPMHLTFSMQYLSRCDGCPPRPSELEMQIDWVRVWQAP